MGPTVRRFGGGLEKPVPHAGFHHRAGSPASGYGPQKGGEDKALGSSRGGLSTKIHLLANGLGEPVAFLTAGQASEFAQALPLLADRQAEIVRADRGCDSSAIVSAIQAMGAEAVIPSKVCRKVQRPHDRTLYQLRNRIERCFNRLKQFRRLAPLATANAGAVFRPPSHSPHSPVPGYTSQDMPTLPGPLPRSFPYVADDRVVCTLNLALSRAIFNAAVG